MRKQFIHWIFFCLALVSGGVIEAQIKNFTLRVDGYRGQLQWEQSSDHTTWQPISGGTTGIFVTQPTKTTYYRARITEEGCTPVYSSIKAAAFIADTFFVSSLVNGHITLPANSSINLSQCKASSSLEEVSVDANGDFEILIPDSTETVTLVVSNNQDSVVMLGHFLSGPSTFTITTESTALALLHLYPGLKPIPANMKEQYSLLYKKEPEYTQLISETEKLIQTGDYIFSKQNSLLISLVNTLVKKSFNQERFRMSKSQALHPVYINSTGVSPDVLVVKNTASFSYTGQLYNIDGNAPVGNSFNVAGSIIKGSQQAQEIFRALTWGADININRDEVRFDMKNRFNAKPGQYEIRLRSGLATDNSVENNAAFKQNMMELFCLTSSNFAETSIGFSSSCIKDIITRGLNETTPLMVSDVIFNGGSVVLDFIFPILKNIAAFLGSPDGKTCLPKTTLTKLMPITNFVNNATPSVYFVGDWKLSKADINACQYLDDEFYLMPCFIMEAKKLTKYKFYTGDTVSVEVVSKVDKAYYPYTDEPAPLKRFVWYSPLGGSFAPDNAVNVPDRTNNEGKATIKFIMPCNESKIAIRTVFAGIPESINKDVFSLDAYHPKLKIITAGSGQTGITGMELANPLKIGLIDELDNFPMFINRFTIQWKNIAGTGKITPVTNGGINSGIIDSAFTWTLGLEEGEQIMEATVTAKNCNWPIQNNVILFKATNPIPKNVTLYSGNNQGGAANTFLADDLVVRVTDDLGNAIGNVAVQWSVVSGGGSIETTSTVTDNNGLAKTRWRLGTADEQKVAATVKKPDGTDISGSPVIFNAGLAIIRTIVGNGIVGYSGDGGDALNASINASNICVDKNGNIYIAQHNDAVIRKVNTQTGIITTVAGNGKIPRGDPQAIGNFFPVNDGVLATADSIRTAEICVDNSGNLYFGSNSRIRRVNTTTGVISTLIGPGKRDSLGVYPIVGRIDSVYVGQVRSLVFDEQGNLFFVANGRIYKLPAGSNRVSIYAGNGVQGNSGDGGPATAASFYKLGILSTDKLGNLYLVDEQYSVVRKITASTGIISKVAGIGIGGYSGDGGLAVNAKLSNPTSVAVDNDGNVFISDYFNHRIRRVDAITGIITTVIGTGTIGFSGDGGNPAQAVLRSPRGIYMDKDGYIYINDWGNGRIRKAKLSK